MLTEGKTYKIRFKADGEYKEEELVLDRTVNTMFDSPNDVCYVFEDKNKEMVAIYPEDISKTEEVTPDKLEELTAA